MSYTGTSTYSYSVTDIEIVMRRFTADIVAIAQSTGALTEKKAREYAHDIEILAKNDCLKEVDLTLLSDSVEIKAVKYTVDSSGDLSMSRPGGVMWPEVENPFLRIVVSYTNNYDESLKEKIKKHLKISWSPTDEDISHNGLTQSNSRDYSSNGWGLQRMDFGA